MPDKPRTPAKVGRCGWLDYAKILRSIHDGVNTTISLSEAHQMQAESMRDILRRMLWLKLVHVSGSETLPKKGHIVPVWALGVGGKPFPTNGPLRPGVDLFAMSSMWKALTKPRTSRELSLLCGLHRQRVAEFCRACAELRILYIAGWRNSRPSGAGTRAPIYALGFDQDNAPAPVPKTPQELWAEENKRRTAKRQAARRLAALAKTSSVFRSGEYLEAA